MNPSRLERIRQLFEQAGELPQEEQIKFLAEQCPEQDIRREVEELLRDSLQSTGDFEQIAEEAIRSPLSELRREQEDNTRPADPGISYDDPEKVGQQIGPYQLVRLIGEGGFGTVWEAQQERPVRRRVAIKFLKVGMATKEIMRRFEAERQTLAMMGHPSIAQVYDAGATDSGRSFFVMELVEGIPLVEFCDKYKLPLKKRLDLFCRICEAIQHAHQRGIVHRDLKPNNILVHCEDEREPSSPILKIIDFGVAKLLRSTSSEQTMVTGFGQIVGTPAYMSPEQASFGMALPDTRTDVYSLGVILYELLTGTLPFGNEVFKQASILAIQRIIQTEDPPRPSNRLAELKSTRLAELESNLDSLQVDYRFFYRSLHTDLDWVVMKCLEKKQQRRYASAHELQQDIQRFLKHEPLVAGPPTTAYRVNKFVRRYRRAVLAACFAVAAFILGFAGTIYGLVQAKQAQAAEAEQRQQAEARTRELEQVTDFQQSVFERLVPEQIGAEIFRSMLNDYDELLKVAGLSNEQREIRVTEFRDRIYQINPTDLARQTFNDFVLKKSSQAISEQFAGQPLVEAALRESLSGSFRQIGLFEEALAEQNKVIQLYEQQALPNPENLFKAKLALVGILIETKSYPEASELLESLSKDPLLNQQSELHATLLLKQGQLEHEIANQDLPSETDYWALAESHFRQAHDEIVFILGEAHPLTLEAELESIRSMRHFDFHFQYFLGSGNNEGAEIALEQEPLFEGFLKKVINLLGEDHPLTWRARKYLVESLAIQASIQNENLDNSVTRLRIGRAFNQLDLISKSQEKILGAYHPMTMETRKFKVYFMLDSTDMDIPKKNRFQLNEMQSILATELEIFSEGQEDVLDTMVQVSLMQREFGFPDQALATQRHIINILERTGRTNECLYGQMYSRMSWIHLYEMNFEAAMETSQRAMDILQPIEAEVPEDIFRACQEHYLRMLIAVNRLGEAYQLHEEWGFEGWRTLLLEWMGKWEEVERIQLQEIKDLRVNGVELAYENDGDYFGIWWWYYMRDMADCEDARFWLQQAIACSQMTSDDDPRRWELAGRFAFALAETGDLENARKWAQIWENERENFLKLYPTWSGYSPAFPYRKRNPYFTKEAYLLHAFHIWDAVGETEKADQYMKQYLEFREFLKTDADPEIKRQYDQIVRTEYSMAHTLWALDALKSRGYFQLAHELIARFPVGIWRVWFGAMDPMETWQIIVDFYKDWDAADPEGNHMNHAIPWQDKLDEFERRLAKWRDYKTS